MRGKPTIATFESYAAPVPLMDSPGERLLREALGATLLSRAESKGGYLEWSDLQAVELADGSAHRVVDPGRGGIWNPRELEGTLSILTSPDGPYADKELAGGLLQYHYQSGPEGGKNLKLRRSMELGLPIIRLHKVAKATYLPIFPVFVIADDPRAREFTLAIDESLRTLPDPTALTEVERRYAERLVRQRVHQRAFRARVMLAYETRCTICVLKKARLLDAAHIIGDRHAHGEAAVSNGLSLCKIHHAAYDQNLLGIRPDYRVEVNAALLEEVDGPMLLHGLQEMHGRQIVVPRVKAQRPDPGRLDERFREFLAS